jgi:hypothetical protein
MKSNYLTLLLIALVAYLCIYATTDKNQEKPNLQISCQKQLPCLAGDVITYEIKLCSHVALEKIIIEPNIQGMDNNSQFVRTFKNGEKCATLQYSFKVPKNININVISLRIKIHDQLNYTEQNETITVYNPPSFDNGVLAMLSK